ncbi:hypothetical protein DAPPUDRAFT_342583, partial [Daphnia pulex]
MLGVAISTVKGSIVGIGTVVMRTRAPNGAIVTVELKNVRHVLDGDSILVSVPKFDLGAGGKCVLHNSRATLTLPNGTTVFTGQLREGDKLPLYTVDNIVGFGHDAATVHVARHPATPAGALTIGAIKDNEALLWHLRLGHPAPSTMSKMVAKGMLPKTVDINTLPV